MDAEGMTPIVLAAVLALLDVCGCCCGCGYPLDPRWEGPYLVDCLIGMVA